MGIIRSNLFLGLMMAIGLGAIVLALLFAGVFQNVKGGLTWFLHASHFTTRSIYSASVKNFVETACINLQRSCMILV